jgi:hypothetical protein
MTHHNIKCLRLKHRDTLAKHDDKVESFRQPGSDLVLFIAASTRRGRAHAASPVLLSGNTPGVAVDNVTGSSTTQEQLDRSNTPNALPATTPASEVFTTSRGNIDAYTRTRTTGPSRHIQNIMREPHSELLEAGVTRAKDVLRKLKDTFSQHAASLTKAHAAQQDIENLLQQPLSKRAVVGVVGSTGSGKSSVINAMLDEERLVPTNCMRACTAVATEISWNDSTDPSAKYRAEIEFIGRADWKRELSILMAEFRNDSGALLREVSNPNSVAGIAWAKFHAVYPTIPRDAVHNCTVFGLMTRAVVSDVLGSIRRLQASQADLFHQQLQKYVDSKEKVNNNSKDHDARTKGMANNAEMEYWPLIKVVKIFTKSPVLSTGAVLVDLPGVQDSNAGRAAVAKG